MPSPTSEIVFHTPDRNNKEGMGPFSELLFDYATLHSSKEPKLLYQLRRETHQKILQPRMLSGPLQGRFLSMLSQLICPKKILELGTFTGYATLCLAEGLNPEGILHTIDKNEELVDFQNKYFEASGKRHQIVQHLGPALDILPQLEGPFDLVFIDADKGNTIDYFEQCIEKVASGGLILTDNVLWSGKVLDTSQKGDLETEILKRFNNMVSRDDRVQTLLLPLRDGLTISRKI